MNNKITQGNLSMKSKLASSVKGIYKFSNVDQNLPKSQDKNSKHVLDDSFLNSRNLVNPKGEKNQPICA